MISQDLILMELDGVRKVVEKWFNKAEEGIPVDNIKEFCGEIMVCASKCETLARIVAEQ